MLLTRVRWTQTAEMTVLMLGVASAWFCLALFCLSAREPLLDVEWRVDSRVCAYMRCEVYCMFIGWQVLPFIVYCAILKGSAGASAGARSLVLSSVSIDTNREHPLKIQRSQWKNELS